MQQNLDAAETFLQAAIKVQHRFGFGASLPLDSAIRKLLIDNIKLAKERLDVCLKLASSDSA